MPVGTRRKALLGHSSAAALDMNFLTGLPSQAAFARAASATAFDSGGNMVSVAANIPRFDYSATPSGSINWIKNSSMAGASAPTTSPTGWQSATGTTNGMTIVIAGVGTTIFADLYQRQFGHRVQHTRLTFQLSVCNDV
jgi:hypothetical protein